MAREIPTECISYLFMLLQPNPSSVKMKQKLEQMWNAATTFFGRRRRRKNSAKHFFNEVEFFTNFRPDVVWHENKFLLIS